MIRKKSKLKPTTTLVTTCAGVQYTEQLSEMMRHRHCSRPANLILESSAHPGFVIDTKPDLDIGVVTSNLLIGKF